MPTQTTDLAEDIFNQLFGPGWASLAAGGETGGAASVFMSLFGVMNSVALAATGVVVVYVLGVGLIGTAHEGQAMGRRYSTLWTPVRSVVAFGMLAPIPGAGGVSMLQATLLFCISMSLGWANDAYNSLLRYSRDHGGTLVAAPPPVISDAGVALAKGAMESLVLQEYFRLRADGAWDQGSWYLTTWEPDPEGADDEFGTGTMRVSFTAPTAVLGGDRSTGLRNADMGAIELRCAAEDDPVCVARTQAILQLIGDIRPHVTAAIESVRSDARADSRIIPYAAQRYGQAERQVIGQMIAQQNEEYQAGLTRFTTTAEAQGWLMAGSYYWTLVGFQQSANEAIRSTPIYVAPDYSRVRRVAFRDFDAFVIATKELADDGQNKAAQVAGAHVTAIEQGKWSSLPREILSTPFKDWGLDYMIAGLTEGDPIANVSDWGHKLLVGTEMAAGAYVAAHAVKGAKDEWDESFWGSVANFVTGVASGGTVQAGEGAAKGALKAISPLVLLSMVPLFLLGLTLAFYLPSVPFILWMSATVSWLIVVVESLIAAPFWAAAHALPQGEGFAGEGGKQGYMLVLNVLARPVLMVTGFAFSVVMMGAIAKLLGMGLSVAKDSILAGHWVGLPTLFAMTFIFGGLVIVLGHKIFSLANHVPDRVLAWVGQMHNPLGGDDEARTRAGFTAAAAQVSSVTQRAGVAAGRGGHGRHAGSSSPSAIDGGAEGGAPSRARGPQAQPRHHQPGQS